MSSILVRTIYAVILSITDVCFENALRIVTLEEAYLAIHLEQAEMMEITA
jgi:hypothetical protein